jgi:transaldolase
MGLFLDSARIEEVQKAVELGFLSGVTTNPTIMAKVVGRPRDIIKQICSISPGHVFYQLTGKTPAEREREACEFADIAPGKVVLKIPATNVNMVLMAKLSKDIPCAATAVYSGAQALVAREAGAHYVIPYVNRATRLLGDGCKLVAEIAAVLRASGKHVEILAASIKSADEATQAVLAGANHLTLPLDILQSLGNHPLSDAAIEEFSRAATQASSEVRS